MTKKQISKYLSQIDWLFSLQNYDKKVIFAYDPCQENVKCEAEITVRRDYQDIEIIIYPIFLNNNDEYQKKILIHELCHSLVSDFKKISVSLLSGKLITGERINDVNEETTSRIENIIWGFMTNKYDGLLKELNKK